MNKAVKRMLDEETKRKLAGLLPTNSDFTVTVTLDAHKDIDEAFQPKFKVSPYSHKELKDVINNSQTLKDDALDNFANESIRMHIRDVTNLINISTGEVIEFVKDADGGCGKELYNSLPMIVKNQLMTLISQISSGISV